MRSQFVKNIQFIDFVDQQIALNMNECLDSESINRAIHTACGIDVIVQWLVTYTNYELIVKSMKSYV